MNEQDTARKALDFLARQGLAPTPTHYSVAWGYVTGDRNYTELVDRYLEQGQRIDERAAARIFSRTNCNEAQARQHNWLQDRIESLIARIEDSIEVMQNEAGEYARTLQDCRDTLLGGVDEAGVAEVIETLAEATRHVMTKNQDLRSQLDDARAEIERQRADLRRMKQAASTDALTGVGNRKSIDDTLKRLLPEPPGEPADFAVIMLDADHFKRVNDTHGHLVGDEVLRRIGDTVSGLVRAGDHVGRYGGEEFVVVLPGASLEMALRKAEAIRHAVSDLRIPLDGDKTLAGITISAGVAVCGAGDTPEALIGRADRALYLAKHQGRNQVVSELALDPEEDEDDLPGPMM